MSKAAFSLLHPGVQEAVWKMGWKEFRPIQAQAIHAVCENGNHLLICAPTAGGKTEAVFLPIVSQITTAPQPSVQALYVGPLKALINDQFQRLERLCAELEISVHRWHGDVPANQKKALREKPAGILLITPESLESNFINFGTKVPRVYRHLSFVVIDELHSLISDVRGVHLRSLLSRLLATAGCSPRIVGLSATIADPQGARAFIAPDAVDTVQVIEDTSTKRKIKFGIRTYLQPPGEGKTTIPCPTADQALALSNSDGACVAAGIKSTASWFQQQIASGSQAIKRDALDEIAGDIIKNFLQSTNLIFGNSKATLEALADRLHEQVRKQGLVPDPFVVHHGSLSKDLREDAEAALKGGLPTTALCSSTLELGIDIGYVHTIGQVDPPWSVTSMVQRLGRSGRQVDEPSIMRLYVREEFPSHQSTLTDFLYPDLLRAIAMTRLMLKKWLEPFDDTRMQLSTLVHQLLSFLKQTGGVRAAALFRALCQQGPFRRINQTQFAFLLRNLGQHQLVEQAPSGELILGVLGERITASFDFYAAFRTLEEFTIRCGSEEIGRLSASIVPPVNEHLLLAGKRWRVIEIIPNQKLALVLLSPGKKVRAFGSSDAEIHTRIVREMRSVLMENSEPAYLDRDSKALLRAARRFAHAVKLDEGNVVIRRSRIQWFPWVGTRVLRTLLLCAQSAKIHVELDGLSISYHLRSLEEFHAHLRGIVSAPPDPILLARLMPLRAVEKYDDFVPEQLLDAANARSRLDMEGAIAACQQVLRNGHAIRSP